MMEVKEYYVIKFFLDEGMQDIQIISRLKDHYEDESFSRMKVYYGINEVK
jgi:hypothetical protein